MTGHVWIWDTSHFDGTLTRDRMAQAKAEGIASVTAKIGEGLADTEGTHDDTTLAAARDVGIEFLGGYLIPRSNASVNAQVDYWLKLADRGEPWWRNYPGWYWQIDLERWPYDAVPASVGIAAAQRIRALTGRWTILYASRGQYGDQLAGWDGPLWNANYGGNPIGPFAAVYPGDTSSRWTKYSGQVPTFLQYGSNTTIAGLTTCDASAFRGSPADLRALISPTVHPLGGDVAIPDAEWESFYTGNLNDPRNVHAVWIRLVLGMRPDELFPTTPDGKIDTSKVPGLRQIAAAQASGGLDVDATAAKLAAALVASGTNSLTTADHDAVKADIVAVLNTVHLAA